MLALLVCLPLSVIHAAPESARDYLLAAAAAATASTSTSTTPNALPTAPVSELPHAELITLTQPAVVRILTRITGTTTIPTFDVNLETLTWSMGSGKSTPTPYDTYLSGSGFVVNPDGYIITNSHVVSTVEVRQALAAQLAASILIRKALSLTPAESAKLTALSQNASTYQKLAADGIQYITDHLSLGTPTIAVVRPSTSEQAATTSSAYNAKLTSQLASTMKAQAASLMRSGIPAKVVYENDQFLDDEKDVALIKIEESGLPALELGNSTPAQEGQPIFVFGFPSTADLSGLATHPSLTSGTVNALADSTQRTFKYIQTDASISPGSSGGPMLDASGNVIGVITVEKADASGNTFAFAIPASLVQDVLTTAGVQTSVPSDYASHVLAGFSLAQARHCKKAITEFNDALAANMLFENEAPLLQSQMDACDALIASGQSLDTQWDAIRIWLEKIGWVIWVAVAAGLIVIIALIIIGIRLLSRLRRDEQALAAMQVGPREIAQPVAGLVRPQPTSEPLPPPLMAFVEQARHGGETEDQIRTSLLAAGWDAMQVERALVR